MNLTFENWNHCDYTHHLVAKVDFFAEEINRAFEVAQKKVPHTDVYDPSGKARDYSVMINRNVAGELADQAVTEILNHFFRSNSLSCAAIEYDDIRQDNFQNTAPYSILIQGPGVATKKAEVRSSFCYRLVNPRSMVEKLSLYGWYTSVSKPAEEQKDLYFQVFYHLRPESIPKQDSWPDIPVFEESLRNGMVTAYVIGGANRQMLLGIGEPRKNDMDGALYQAISPANKGYDINRMRELSCD